MTIKKTTNRLSMLARTVAAVTATFLTGAFLTGAFGPDAADARQAARSPAEIATFGGGCFWCIEAVFEQLRGIEKIESGYAGGIVPDPTYEQVSTGKTGHAEVVQLTFDSGVVSYRELLEVFFTVHDPTTEDRQGADVGTQYRSVVFYHSPQQQKTARSVVADLEKAKVWADPIVTRIQPIETFYKAEAYHQDYFARNPSQAYCRVVIAPKVVKVRKKFLQKLRR